MASIEHPFAGGPAPLGSLPVRFAQAAITGASPVWFRFLNWRLAVAISVSAL